MKDSPLNERQQQRATPPKKCVCPQCGYETGRAPAVPCWSVKCPRCGMLMTGD